MIKNSAAFFLLVTVLFSCGERPGNTDNTGPGPGTTGFAVLRYDSAALEYRLDSIHNRGLVLQFCVRNAGTRNDSYQLISYAYDTLNDHNNSWMPDTLSIVRDSVPKIFTGSYSMGNNEVTREQLLDVVRDSAGNRFSYDYLMFIPVVEGVFRHVVYLMKPVKNNKPVEGARMQMTSPMPPARNWN